MDLFILFLTIGSASIGSVVRSEIQTANDCPNKPGTDKLDLIFLIDGSTSIGQSNFTKILQFVAEVIGHLDVGENRSRVGIVQFNGREKTELHLNSIYRKADLLPFVRQQITYLTGVTLTGKAVRYVMAKEFKPEQGDRPGVPNVLVVVTDGRAQDDVEIAAQTAWGAGVELYAIGVTKLIDPDQLLEIANFHNDHVFHVEDFENFTRVIESLTVQFSSEHRCNMAQNTTAVPIPTTTTVVTVPSTTTTVRNVTESTPSTSTTTSTTTNVITTTTSAKKQVGEVRVACDQDVIRVTKTIEGSFKGNVYVKGHFDDSKCKIDYANQSDIHSPSITINIHDCGADRKRSANPRGVYISATVVFMFHKFFNTKRDTAYNVRCFYMEAEKSVSQQIDVSMLTTTASLTEQADMPACDYSIRSSSELGPVVKFAQIGMPVYHRWECEPPHNTTGMFGMKVHSCFAKGSQGSRVNILDVNGCPVDNTVMPQLIYSDNLLVAHVPTMVFKFADDQSIFFDCQISICLKAAGTCDGVTPPKCDNNRGKRSKDITNAISNFLGDDVIDVQSHKLNVFDIPDNSDNFTDPFNSHQSNIPVPVATHQSNRICFSTHSMVLITCCVVLTLFAAIGALGLALILRKRSVHKTLN